MSKIARATAGAFRAVHSKVKHRLLLLAKSILLSLAFVANAYAASAPPAMITPGQFNVSATGGAIYSIPIAVPPGTGGMAPALSLEYSSQNGDGLEGLGWNLNGIPSIGRCPRTLAQDGAHGGINFDTGDRFCMEGQRLVAVVGSYGTNNSEYRTEIEGFSRVIARCGDPACTVPDYFEVHTKAGQTMYFGWTDDPDNANNQSRFIIGSGTASRTRAWGVEKITDTKHNYLTVIYSNDPVTGQSYPTDVNYTGNNSPSLTPLSPYVRVHFVYTARSDVVPTYQAGYLLETVNLLTNIQAQKQVAGSWVNISDYRLTYTPPSSGGRHNELIQVQQFSEDGSYLQGTSFTWQGGAEHLDFDSFVATMGTGGHNVIVTADFDGDGITDVLPTDPIITCPTYFNVWHGPSFLAPYAFPNPMTGVNSCEMSAMSQTLNAANGTGNVLLFESGRVAATNVYKNGAFAMNSNGTVANQGYLDMGSVYPPAPSIIGDFDGNGLTDIIKQGSPSSIYWGATGSGFESPINGPSYPTNVSLGAGDFDGDGCTDIADFHDHKVYFQCGGLGSSIDLPSMSNAVPIFGDFNGDGKLDILMIGKSAVPATLYLSTGTGFAPLATTLPSDLAKYNVFAGDFNGDGKTDIALVVSNGDCLAGTGNACYTTPVPHTVFLSTGKDLIQATNDSGAAVAFSNYSGYTYDFISADANSDGASDFWLKSQTMTSANDGYFPVKYTPELISGFSNGIGATTSVTYDRINSGTPLYNRPSTPAIYPQKDVNGPLYVVKQVDASNGLGTCSAPGGANCYTSIYSYSVALEDLTGRGFLGFNKMSVTDMQTGIVQTTTYNQTFPQIGLIVSQVKVCPQAICGGSTDTILSSTNNNYSPPRVLGIGTDGVKIYFVGLAESDVASNDADGSPLPEVRTYYTYDCDSGLCDEGSQTGFGNVLTVKVDTLIGGSLASEKITANAYAYDTADWLLGRLVEANVSSAVNGLPAQTRRTTYCYDLPTSWTAPNDGTVCPAVGISGLLTAELIEPGASDNSLTSETDYGYDRYGNKTSVVVKACIWSPGSCTATTRETHTAYDDTIYHAQFPTLVTNQLGQSESYNYDESYYGQDFGIPTSHTGPNGLSTQWQYDPFGRKVLEIRPDGTRGTITYILCTTASCTGLPSGEAAAGAPSNVAFAVISTPQDASASHNQDGPLTITFYDSLSRVLAVDSEGFDGPSSGCSAGPCWIRVATQYDLDGRVKQTSRPYFIVGGTPQWTVVAYDPIGRIGTNTYPDGTSTAYGYHGLTTTVTNERQTGTTITYQTTTTLKNAQGLVQSVTDNENNATTYVYDDFDNLSTITDPAIPTRHVTSYTYDIRGRKKVAADPDMGSWGYTYDGYGELYQQTDAIGHVTTLTYDGLGRVLSRTEPDLTSRWTYDNAPGKGIGQLATATTGSGYTKALTYDDAGQPASVTLTVDGAASSYTVSYDADTARLSTVMYPSGFTARYNYTTFGYLYQVQENGGAGQVFWTANTRDAELHLLTQTAGNAVNATQVFDPLTGRLKSIVAGLGVATNVSSQVFMYDSLGDLTSRTWLPNSTDAAVGEAACYDDLNRLTKIIATVGGDCTGSGSVSATYDAIGNITEKTDVCTDPVNHDCMHYGSATTPSPIPHAITAIDGTYNGVTNPTFTYDANGNMTAGGGRSVNLTSFNMVANVTDGGNTDALTYDTEHSRIRQVATGIVSATTYYLNDPISGVMAEKVVSGGNTTWRDYIMADGHIVALRTVGLASPPAWGTVAWNKFMWTPQTATIPEILYFTLDHLGSISVVTNSTGMVVERDSYDAWGKRRNSDGTAIPCTNGGSYTTRGFTGQEMMDNVCLINFNARVYDPSLGRFMSPDPTTETVYDLQVLNRYSYVGNNPLSLTDATGLCFLGCFWNSSEFREFAAIAVAILLGQPEALGAIGESTAFIQSAIGTVVNGAVIGGISGGISGGNLKSIGLGALQGGLFAEAGNLLQAEGRTTILGSSTADEFVAHGVVGGIVSVTGGGSFFSGFVAAGVASFTPAPITGQTFTEIAEGASEAAILGGIGSILGGGKFANGAETGAFGYLLNGGFHRRGGIGPVIQGANAVAAAESDFVASGYKIVYDTQVAVDVPGFDTPRYYDFLVEDPTNSLVYGVEVKSSISDMVRLNDAQLLKDAAIVEHGGVTSVSGLPIKGVYYAGSSIGSVDWRPFALQIQLQMAGFGERVTDAPGFYLTKRYINLNK